MQGDFIANIAGVRSLAINIREDMNKLWIEFVNLESHSGVLKAALMDDSYEIVSLMVRHVQNILRSAVASLDQITSSLDSYADELQAIESEFH